MPRHRRHFIRCDLLAQDSNEVKFTEIHCFVLFSWVFKYCKQLEFFFFFIDWDLSANPLMFWHFSEWHVAFSEWIQHPDLIAYYAFKGECAVISSLWRVWVV